MLFLGRFEQPAGVAAGGVGIDDLLRPFLGLGEPALKQIELRESPPRGRRVGCGLQEARFGQIIFPLGQIQLAEPIQTARMIRVQGDDFLECPFGLRQVARVEAGPAQPVPGVFARRVELDGLAELRGRFSPSALPARVASLRA